MYKNIVFNTLILIYFFCKLLRAKKRDFFGVKILKKLNKKKKKNFFCFLCKKKVEITNNKIYIKENFQNLPICCKKIRKNISVFIVVFDDKNA